MDGSSQYVDENNSIEEREPVYAISKKRGRPAKKGDKYWLDDEIEVLIRFWSGKELLYNCRHMHYHDRDRRAKAINDIRELLEEEGINATNKQIHEKMTNLRNYFSAERRKIEASKKSGAATDTVYASRWKFFIPLEFLQDNFIPRRTGSNLALPNEGDSFLNVSIPEDMSPTYNIDNRPSAKAARKLSNQRKDIAENIMASATQVLQRINSKYENKDNRNQNEKDTHQEDRCFTDLIFQMLKELPDSEEKSMVKIEFQQKLMHLRFEVQRPRVQMPNFAISDLMNSYQGHHFNQDCTPLPPTNSQYQPYVHRFQQISHTSSAPSPLSPQSDASVESSQN